MDSAVVDDSAPPTDSTPTPDGTADDTGGACNALSNDAPHITSTKSTAPLPTGTGGSVADGTYFLTSATIYAQPSAGSGSDQQETIAIAGGKLDVVKLGVTHPIDRTSWSYATSSTTLTLTRTCPSSKTQTFGYTADATTLTTYETATNIAKTYTKQ